MNTCKVLKSFPTEENTEIRLAEINRGYSVGVWDNDAQAYATNLTIFSHNLKNAKQKAIDFYNKQCNQAYKIS